MPTDLGMAGTRPDPQLATNLLRAVMGTPTESNPYLPMNQATDYLAANPGAQVPFENLVSALAKTYTEQPGNPLSSERERDMLRMFMSQLQRQTRPEIYRRSPNTLMPDRVTPALRVLPEAPMTEGAEQLMGVIPRSGWESAMTRPDIFTAFGR
jgi:hypothetical protein